MPHPQQGCSTVCSHEHPTQAKASTGGQAQTRLRSPYAWSMRAHRRPVLACDEGAHGVCRLFPRVRVVPLPRDERDRGVRRVHERVVVGRPATGGDPLRLGLDHDHGLDEALDLVEVLRLGRLDHQRARDRERHGRRVEAVVDEALGDVVDRDAGGLLERTQIEDALVSHPPVLARVEHRKCAPSRSAM